MGVQPNVLKMSINHRINVGKYDMNVVQLYKTKHNDSNMNSTKV